jgi:hypothetical protein
MAGLWKAIELFLETDHEAEYRTHLAQATALASALEPVAGARWSIESDWEDWPAPVVRVSPTPGASWSPSTIQATLMAGDPPVHIDLFKGDLLVSTHCLRPGEEFEIARQLVPLLAI